MEYEFFTKDPRNIKKQENKKSKNFLQIQSVLKSIKKKEEQRNKNREVEEEKIEKIIEEKEKMFEENFNKGRKGIRRNRAQDPEFVIEEEKIKEHIRSQSKNERKNKKIKSKA